MNGQDGRDSCYIHMCCIRSCVCIYIYVYVYVYVCCSIMLMCGGPACSMPAAI